MTIFITIYSLIFLLIAWFRLNLGITFLFLLLPIYLVRFKIFQLPTTLLEIMILIIIFTILANPKHWKNCRIKCKKFVEMLKANKFLFSGILIFLLGATLSILFSADTRSALGEWKAFYMEPAAVFLILLAFLKKENIDHVLFSLVLCGFATSLLAIYQHFTGWMVPWEFWKNNNSFRVTAWYGFPNGVGLFLAPIFPMTLHLIHSSWKNLKNKTNIHNSKLFNKIILAISILTSAASVLAVLFAKSTGGLIGIAASIGFLLLLNKKTRWCAILISIIGLITVASLPQNNSIKQELLLQDRSGQIRISIWKETAQFLKDKPFSGAGLASYSKKIEPYHTTVKGEGIEIFHHPHNIFLTIWVNVGLTGLIGFLLILASFFAYGIKRAANHESSTMHFLLASMVVILTTGLVDSPYIKNDMALVFWVFPALLIILKQKKYEKLEDIKT